MKHCSGCDLGDLLSDRIRFCPLSMLSNLIQNIETVLDIKFILILSLGLGQQTNPATRELC